MFCFKYAVESRKREMSRGEKIYYTNRIRESLYDFK